MAEEDFVTGDTDQHHADEADDNPSGLRARVEPATILVLEDDALARKAVCRLVRLSGCTPLPAATVAEAEQLVAERMPTALMIDANLKDGTGPQGGIDFLRRIRDQHLSSVPAMVHTAASKDELTPRPAQLGARFLEKPAKVNDQLRFLLTAKKWSTFEPHLRRIIARHESLDERHYRIAVHYLFLGNDDLHEAVGISSGYLSELQSPLLKALDIHTIHLLWREVCLFADAAELRGLMS